MARDGTRPPRRHAPTARPSAARPLERLGASDLMFVSSEDVGWVQYIGALAVLDGDALPTSDARLDVDALRRHVERRLPDFPRSRQVLHRPAFGLGWPLWLDAAAIDLSYHVSVVPVPGPGDEDALLRTVEELRDLPLDPLKPLWRLWLLPGMSGGRVGWFVKLHHSVADGIAGIAALAAFLDTVPAPPEKPAPPWSPSPGPTPRQLLADNVGRHLAALRRLLGGLLHPVAALRSWRRAWPVLREAFFEEKTPETSLTARPIGQHRRLAVVRADLDAVKAVARSHDAKVNDVLMAVVAGGFRDLLLARGERVDGVAIRAAVPVDVRAADPEGGARSNDVGMMMVPLPLDEGDASRRLALVAAETRRRKTLVRPAGGALFRNGVLQRTFFRLSDRQRAVSTHVTNVPGPPVPLFFAGARVRELFPVTPILGNVSVGIGALSYAGRFDLTVVADRDLVPDVDVFVRGVRRTIDELVAADADHARPAAAEA